MTRYLEISQQEGILELISNISKSLDDSEVIYGIEIFDSGSDPDKVRKLLGKKGWFFNEEEQIDVSDLGKARKLGAYIPGGKEDYCFTCGPSEWYRLFVTRR